MLVPIIIGGAVGYWFLRGKTGAPLALTDAHLGNMANTLCEEFSDTPPPFQTVDGMAAAIGRRAYPDLDWPPKMFASTPHKLVWSQLQAWTRATIDAAAGSGYADVCAFLLEQGVAPPVPQPELPEGWFIDGAGMYCTIDGDGDELCFSPDDLPSDFGAPAPTLLGGSAAPKTTGSSGGGGAPQAVSWNTGIFGGGDRPMNWAAVSAFWYAAGVKTSIGPAVDPNGASCPPPGVGSRQGCPSNFTVKSFQAMWNRTQNWGDMLRNEGLGGLHPLLEGPKLQKDGRLGANTLLAMSKVHEWQSKVDPGIGRWRAVVYDAAVDAGAPS